MKKLIVIVTCLAIIISIAGIIIIQTDKDVKASQDAMSQSEDIRELGVEYMQYIKNGEFEKAYALTTDDFRTKIPESAFSLGLSNFSKTLQNFTAGDVVVNNNKANMDVYVEYYYLEESMKSKYSLQLALIKVNDIWKLDLDWVDFLSSKREVQKPLAVIDNKGTTLSIKSILLYPKHNFSYLRIDIDNNSSRTLCWEVNRNGESNYILDPNTSNVYNLIELAGVQYKEGDAFELISNDESNPKIIIGDGVKGSIYLNFELLPDTMSQFDLVLSGLTFQSDDAKWGANITNIDFIFDEVPSN